MFCSFGLPRKPAVFPRIRRVFLPTTLEGLQSTLEDLPTTLEELQTTLEKLQTTLEGLQTTLEGLQTTLEDRDDFSENRGRPVLHKILRVHHGADQVRGMRLPVKPKNRYVTTFLKAIAL
jgi:uncharacterized coiled-coil protein SlyX